MSTLYFLVDLIIIFNVFNHLLQCWFELHFTSSSHTHSIFANHILFLMGLGMTSAAYASALQPAIPVFTFMFAIALG